jgi:hypothetical protein
MTDALQNAYMVVLLLSFYTKNLVGGRELVQEDNENPKVS